ncbi:MAG: YggS family pyridoxal phosphate-dependent enzyme [Cloacibacillus sp.]
MVTNVKENIEKIKAEIAEAASKSGRSPSQIKLMGVTKYHPVELMVEAAGLIDLIGENRVQEAYSKRGEWPEGVKSCPWHLIGHLQRNKIRRALESFQLIESIDSLETAVALDRVLNEGDHLRFPIFIEVNMSREAAKNGVVPEDAEALMLHILKHCPALSIEGLMTVAANTENETELRGAFGGLRKLRDSLSTATGLELPELSMGMSGDFRTAIEEGSTIVRIGSAIFGERSYAETSYLKKECI